MMTFKANGTSFKFMVISQAAVTSAADKSTSSAPNQWFHGLSSGGWRNPVVAMA
jgi:hypothetical protein